MFKHKWLLKAFIILIVAVMLFSTVAPLLLSILF